MDAKIREIVGEECGNRHRQNALGLFCLTLPGYKLFVCVIYTTLHIWLSVHGPQLQ